MMSEDYELAFQLKEQHFPKSFYKYRKLNCKTIENISDNYLFLAEIASLNDPFECSLQLDNNESLRRTFSNINYREDFKRYFGKELTSDDIKRINKSQHPLDTYSKICNEKNIPYNLTWDNLLEKVQKGWEQILDDSNKDIKICSFSELNDSLLLWSHYADEHKGICIEYDLENEDEIRPFLYPIMYSDKIYKISCDDFRALRALGSSLIKSKDWEYEAEWRLTILRQREVFSNKITVTNPKAVFLGTRFHLNTADIKGKLLDILEKKKVPVYQMKKHSEEFKLVKQ